jgi:hypothetical protein
MRAFVAVVAGVVALLPFSLQGWGLDAHRFLTRRALDGLPAEIRPFFLAERDFIGEHSVDPDMWRIVALRSGMGEEDPNHFLDIDGLGEPPPFTNVPREWPALVARYGAERANRAGRLPWRAEEVFTLLVARMQDFGKAPSFNGANSVRYLTAVLAHYVEDAHQPLHATENYDGQLTGQRGVHARFEADLVMRNLGSLKLAPVDVRPFAGFRDFMFATIVESQSLVAQVLDADRKAAAGRDLYDDAYFNQFLAGARPVLERRLGDAASGLASAIVSAWMQAGKPALPAALPRTPARIRRVPSP